jgi:RNA recognition motif-containing protein
MNIYIANLHFSVNESELLQLFEQFGEVNSVKLITDKKKKSKGYAFVDVDSDIDIIQELNGKEYRGRTVKVSEAQK